MTAHVPILGPPVRRWECPGCNQAKVTREHRPHTPFHTCRNGLTMPLVPEGERRKVTVNEREDYVGREVVTRDTGGNVPMNVTVERPDGVDVSVYAPCAVASLRDLA